MALLSIIISALAVFWAVYTKARGRNRFECVTLALIGIVLLMNSTYAYLIGRGVVISAQAKNVQLVAEMMIIPLSYMFFSSKIGRQWKSPATVILWVIALYGLLPSLMMVLDNDFSSLPDISMSPHKFYFVWSGDVIFSVYSADLVSFFQAVLTSALIFPTVKLMHRYGLVFSRNAYFFLAWWIACIAFAVGNSFLSSEQLASPGGQLFFLGSMFVLMSSIYVFIALGYDRQTVIMKIRQDETEETTVNLKVDSFVEMCRKMADDVRRLMDNEKVYLDPDFSTENAIDRLGTNRTYFSKMMQAEFGCKFTDLLNNARLECAREMLASTDKPIGDVATESGFNGASYLSRRFSLKYGISPTEYRKSQGRTTE